MYVHFWRRSFDGFNDMGVGIASVLRVYAALHAHLGRASVPSFDRAARNFFVGEVIRSTSQIL